MYDRVLIPTCDLGHRVMNMISKKYYLSHAVKYLTVPILCFTIEISVIAGLFSSNVNCRSLVLKKVLYGNSSELTNGSLGP